MSRGNERLLWFVAALCVFLFAYEGGKARGFSIGQTTARVETKVEIRTREVCKGFWRWKGESKWKSSRTES